MARSSHPEEAPALEFGPFRLILATQLLYCDNRRIHLGSRVRTILLMLLENAGQIVPHTQLLERVWPVAIVSAGTLRVHVAALRKIFQQCAGESDYIATIHGHGYRFAIPVRRVNSEPGNAAVPVSIGNHPWQGDSVDFIPALLHRQQESERLLNCVLEVLETLAPGKKAQFEAAAGLQGASRPYVLIQRRCY
jgi:DNA-binding winged helix-turn-helix (wHTH) protein